LTDGGNNGIANRKSESRDFGRRVIRVRKYQACLLEILMKTGALLQEGPGTANAGTEAKVKQLTEKKYTCQSGRKGKVY